MWTRFNYFVVIEAALIGGKTIFGDKAISLAGLCFGFVLSLVWYVMGAEDRYLVQVYRAQVREAAEVLTSALWQVPDHPYHYVGDPTGVSQSIKLSVAGWRLEFISTTRLASLLPLGISLVWLGLLLRMLIVG